MQACLWLPSKLEKPKKHIGHQNLKNRFIFCQKTDAKKTEKPETAMDNKTENPTWKMAKTENPNAPLGIV